VYKAHCFLQIIITNIVMPCEPTTSIIVLVNEKRIFTLSCHLRRFSITAIQINNTFWRIRENNITTWRQLSTGKTIYHCFQLISRLQCNPGQWSFTEVTLSRSSCHYATKHRLVLRERHTKTTGDCLCLLNTWFHIFLNSAHIC